nr:AraC family transcriptional regulator [uncultured Arsenicibacter sp.]
MAKTETLEDFYQQKFNWLPGNLQQDLGHFNVFQFSNYQKGRSTPVYYSRRDFYKISLIKGYNRYHYADRSIDINGATLIFFNPQVPYTWEALSEEMEISFCIFRDAFFAEHSRNWLHDLPMFRPGGRPAYVLNEAQYEQVHALFQKMIAEINTDYPFKFDLLRNYVAELIHFALKQEPEETLHQHPNAQSRLTAVFTELLERQFPIETPAQRFSMRSAGDFARQLAVHVNYLNRSVRTTTGKTTTDHIAERMASEAMALLKHTDWNIAEIGYCLGFDEPAHFNHFFKKQTSQTPSSYRKV